MYGLGANALDLSAVLRIFRFKGRPLTDPLIVHLPSALKATECIEMSPQCQQLFEVLSARFWPGPLTIVAKARSHIPLEITAGTGWVGVRVPAHPVALALLQAAGVPVAAPSANRFGHVSPTQPEHVMADLGQHPILVLDSGETPCRVGIESTVVKLWDESAEHGQGGGGVYLTVLRRGGVSVEDLQAAVEPLAQSGLRVTIDVRSHSSSSVHPPSSTQAQEQRQSEQEEHTEGAGDEAPGMRMTHYAPDVEAVLVSSASALPPLQPSQPILTRAPRPLEHCIVLDFAGQLKDVQGQCMAYRDLSATGDIYEARAALFSTLRWTESIPSAQLVLMADPLLLWDNTHTTPQERRADRGHAEAIRDRLFRAASGRVLYRDAVLLTCAPS